GSSISPQSSSNLGHIIRLPAQFVIEYYNFFDSCFGVQTHDSTNQRCRRVSVALMHALSHELSHSSKGHNVVTSGAGLNEDQTSLASETDADFSAGMMSFLFFYNSTQEDELHELLSLRNNAAPLLTFTKDSGYAAVMLAFFIHCRSKGEVANYHSANIRFNLISAGILFAILNKDPSLAKFLTSGIEEAIQSLSNLESAEHRAQAKDFLEGNRDEFSSVITSTSVNVDKLRTTWEESSDIFKIATKYMGKQ
ncbi:MAG: hypothetical protein KKC55_14390, partial [Gammaproteobacteria bacterium]|nr:hypothetical protein [Gammaproteobacteria bacterium]